MAADDHPMSADAKPTATARSMPTVGVRPDLLACAHCDAVWRRPAVGPGQLAYCARCGAPLLRGHRLDLDGQLALTLAAVLVLIIANSFPVIELDVQGRLHGSTLLQAIGTLIREDALPVAIVAALTAFAAPLLELSVRLWALWSARTDAGRGLAPGAQVRLALRWLERIERWSMTEVYLIGILITVVRLSSMARVVPEIGLFGFAVLTVLIGALRAVGSHAIWDALTERDQRDARAGAQRPA